MERRHFMRTTGGIAAVSAFGLGSTQTVGAHEDEHEDEDEDTPVGEGPGCGQVNPGELPRHDDIFTLAPPDIGGYDFALLYYAEGVVNEPNPPGDRDSPAEHYQLDILNRDIEQVVRDRQDAHDFYREFWGIDFDAELSEGQVTEDNVFDEHDGVNDNGEKIAEELPTQLHPQTGYTAVFMSGRGMPNNYEPEGTKGPHNTTNRDPKVTGKVRDGGWWVDVRLTGDTVTDGFASAEEGKVDNLVGEPTFWFNDKLTFDGVGLDQGIHDGYPEGSVDLFWGNYSIRLGDNEPSLDAIHYESRFPTVMKPRSGKPQDFLCELEFARNDGENIHDIDDEERQDLRDELDQGRVHGTVYPPGETEDGEKVMTLRNVLTFPPSRNRVENVAPGR